MLLKLCKISVAMLFINLYVIFTLTGSHIPNGTLIFGLLAFVFMLIDMITSGSYHLFADIRVEMITLVFFAIWSFLTIPLAYNSSVSMNAAVDFLQKLLFVFIVYYICRKDKSLKFPVVLFLIISFFSAFAVILLHGLVEDRLSLSENISINSTGNLMVLGVFCALYLYKGGKWYSFSLLVGTISLFLFVIALTGSRKSLFATIILLIGFLILMPKRPFYFTASSFFSFIFLLILIYFLYTKVSPMLTQTSLYDRLFDERVSAKAQISSDFRVLLYQSSWYDFKTSPITGLGLSGFLAKHGNYTHSAYMEVLSGTGIIGAVLYFASYVCTFVKLWKKMWDKTQEFFELRRCRLIFVFFIAFLYIGIGIGHLVDNLSMLELGMFLAAGCSLVKNEEEVSIKEGVAVPDAG